MENKLNVRLYSKLLADFGKRIQVICHAVHKLRLRNATKFCNIIIFFDININRKRFYQHINSICHSGIVAAIVNCCKDRIFAIKVFCKQISKCRKIKCIHRNIDFFTNLFNSRQICAAFHFKTSVSSQNFALISGFWDKIVRVASSKNRRIIIFRIFKLLCFAGGFFFKCNFVAGKNFCFKRFSCIRFTNIVQNDCKRFSVSCNMMNFQEKIRCVLCTENFCTVQIIF